MLDNKSSVSVCQTANTQKYQHWDQADVLGFYASTGALLSTILQELDKAQVIKGPKTWRLGHVTLATPTWRLGHVTHGQALLSTILQELDKAQVIKVSKIWTLGHVTPATPT